ncbi:hypothetical protein ACQEU8_00890 [Streptomyces sp. CA-250714]|uniref:hypothetical protein n=1 Tax=Streptomyces sp. CA-250714 TaxID=3240060 RepID=UPI003D8A01F9
MNALIFRTALVPGIQQGRGRARADGVDFQAAISVEGQAAARMCAVCRVQVASVDVAGEDENAMGEFHLLGQRSGA